MTGEVILLYMLTVSQFCSTVQVTNGTEFYKKQCVLELWECSHKKGEAQAPRELHNCMYDYLQER